MARKAIIIAPKNVADFLAEEYTDWDIGNCTSIADMWDGLLTERLSAEAEMVLIVDALFDETPELVVEAVALLSPEALVMILSYSNKDEIIRAQVEKFSHDNNLPEASFHFVRADIALLDIEEILDKHDHAAESIIYYDNSANRYASHDEPVITATASKGGPGKPALSSESTGQ